MIRMQSAQASGEALKKEVDDDIEAFNRYFQSLGNDPLVRSEVAILSTYLHYKCCVEKGG